MCYCCSVLGERKRFRNELGNVLEGVCNGYRLCVKGDLSGWFGNKVKNDVIGIFGVPGQNDSGRFLC